MVCKLFRKVNTADALGLTYWKMGLIILPALKITIPSIVNTFIGLFKDTSLVLIIGMFDVLGIGQAANTDPDWLVCWLLRICSVGPIFLFRHVAVFDMA